MFSLSRCYPGLVPSSTKMSSQCRPVCHGFTTVKPGRIPVHPGDCRFPGYPQFAQDYLGLSRLSPGAIMVCNGVAPVFYISHGSPWLSNRGERWS